MNTISRLKYTLCVKTRLFKQPSSRSYVLSWLSAWWYTFNGSDRCASTCSWFFIWPLTSVDESLPFSEHAHTQVSKLVLTYELQNGKHWQAYPAGPRGPSTKLKNTMKPKQSENKPQNNKSESGDLSLTWAVPNSMGNPDVLMPSSLSNSFPAATSHL